MPSEEADVLVIGAGAAGLAAAAMLSQAGLAVIILEARDRIGGRILTLHLPELGVPLELGAEFVHGRPPEIFDIIHRGGLRVQETAGELWHVEDGRLRPGGEVYAAMEEVFRRMDASRPDHSFEEFLDSCDEWSEQARTWARAFVSGFHAASPELISVHWLIRGLQADEKIEGNRSFRFPAGYDALTEQLRAEIKPDRFQLRLRTTVEEIAWRRGEVRAQVRREHRGATCVAGKAIVTLPVSILKLQPREQGGVRFSPDPPGKRAALDGLEMGSAARITLRFRERFWAQLEPQPGKSLDSMSFLFSQEEWFPTWWTTMPVPSPLLTGWAGGARAKRLSRHQPEFVCARALDAVSRLMGIPRHEIEAQLASWHLHDWQCDPFSRGAYSYARVGSADAARDLSSPVEDTLFFAGEHCDVSGHNGTVHGAIASGRRAALRILDGSPDQPRRGPARLFSS